MSKNNMINLNWLIGIICIRIYKVGILVVDGINWNPYFNMNQEHDNVTSRQWLQEKTKIIAKITYLD